jgi:electron transfer flavoprotein alpha subunit
MSPPSNRQIPSLDPSTLVFTFLLLPLIFTGNALATVQSSDPIKILTVRTTAFEKANEKSSESEIVPLPSEIDTTPKVNSDMSDITYLKGPVAEWVKDEVKESARPDLNSARVVVSGGRALKVIPSNALP